MYRVIVRNSGKYHNVIMGTRYCLTKRPAVNLAVMLDSVECDYRVEKFVRLYEDVFCWSEGEVDKKFWYKVEKSLTKLSRRDIIKTIQEERN